MISYASFAPSCRLVLVVLAMALPRSAAAEASTPGCPSGVSQPATTPIWKPVVVKMYTSDQCKDDEAVFTITFDLEQDCFGWSRLDESCKQVDNSATRWQCYRDRVCYTQHIETLTCNTSKPTDRQARTDACLPEPYPSNKLWTKLVGGNEDCPPAPPGFECPISAEFEGTPGIQGWSGSTQR